MKLAELFNGAGGFKKKQQKQKEKESAMTAPPTTKSKSRRAQCYFKKKREDNIGRSHQLLHYSRSLSVSLDYPSFLQPGK